MVRQAKSPELEELLSRAIQRLSVISRVSALGLVRTASSREEQVELLTVAGYSKREIADLLGIRYSTVAVIQFTLRKGEKKKRAKLAKTASK